MMHCLTVQSICATVTPDYQSVLCTYPKQQVACEDVVAIKNNSLLENASFPYS